MNDILKNSLDKLDREREQMYKSVESLSEDQLHDDSYGWSIIQVFSHLNDAEKGSISYMTKKMQAGDKMQKYSIGNKLRMLILKGFLQSSMKWKAPSYISNPKGNYSLEEMKDLWDKTRKETKAYVENYPEEYLNRTVFKHPFAGRLDLVNAIDSMTYHQRHHMHQIKRIKKVVS